MLKKPFKKRQIYILKKLKRRHKSSKTALLLSVFQNVRRRKCQLTKEGTPPASNIEIKMTKMMMVRSNRRGGLGGGFSVAESPADVFCLLDNYHHLDHYHHHHHHFVSSSSSFNFTVEFLLPLSSVGSKQAISRTFCPSNQLLAW